MILRRVVRRGILAGRLIIAAPCRPPEKVKHRDFNPRRSFSINDQSQKQTDERFFWPSRPDFLPTKLVKSDDSTRINWKVRQEEEAQSIKRFRPIVGAKILLPSSEGITYTHAPLYTFIAKADVDTAWLHFVSHLNELSTSKVIPLKSGLFDALFWLVAAENPTSRMDHEEIFGRVEVLLKYASSQVNYGLTRLQLHRTVYIWTTLWEQYELAGIPFLHKQFIETVLGYLNQVDSRIASRIFGRMLNDCKTPDEMEKVTQKIRSWLQAGHCEATRQETWASTSLTSTPNDEVYFKEEHKGALDGRMWETLLAKCFEIGISTKTIDAGMLAVRQKELDTSLDYVSQFLAFLKTDRLYRLLPAELRDAATKVDHHLKAPTAPTSDENEPVEEDVDFTEEDKSRLMYAVAFVLATRLHYSAALCLFEADKPKNEKDEMSVKNIEVYTAAANACARLALGGYPLKESSSHDAKWTLVQLQRGLHLFLGCDWYESRSRNTTARLLIKALRECIIRDRAKAQVQDASRWLLLLRQFTTVLLSHDPGSTAFHGEGGSHAWSRLLQLHIYLEDYPFAKRVFLVHGAQEGHMKDLSLIRADFLWLFQQSLEIEPDAQFANRLFLYQKCLDGGEDQVKHRKPLPPRLLQKYFWKLKASSGGGVAIKMLYEHLDTENLSDPWQASQMMRTYFSVGKGSLNMSLDMAVKLLGYWEQSKEAQSAMLIRLYSTALQGSTRHFESLDPLLRARTMGLFRRFRDHFAASHRQKRHSLAQKYREHLESIYACGLKMLVASEETSPVHKLIEELFEELKDKWTVEQYSGQIWSLRIEACLVGNDADIERAKELYFEALQNLDASVVTEKRARSLSASVTAKLMMALARKGSYKDSLDLISTYQNYAGPLSHISKAYIEGAHIAVLHRQGHVQEALQRLNILKAQGDDIYSPGTTTKRKDKARWLKIIDQATGKLEEHHKRDQHGPRQGSSEKSPIAFDEEEHERARIFRAMAGGQPWKRPM